MGTIISYFCNIQRLSSCTYNSRIATGHFLTRLWSYLIDLNRNSIKITTSILLPSLIVATVQNIVESLKNNMSEENCSKVTKKKQNEVVNLSRISWGTEFFRWSIKLVLHSLVEGSTSPKPSIHCVFVSKRFYKLKNSISWLFLHSELWFH